MTVNHNPDLNGQRWWVTLHAKRARHDRHIESMIRERHRLFREAIVCDGLTEQVYTVPAWSEIKSFEVE